MLGRLRWALLELIQVLPEWIRRVLPGQVRQEYC